jgi:hypothetical protein
VAECGRDFPFGVEGTAIAMAVEECAFKNQRSQDEPYGEGSTFRADTAHGYL